MGRGREQTAANRLWWELMWCNAHTLTTTEADGVKTMCVFVCVCLCVCVCVCVGGDALKLEEVGDANIMGAENGAAGPRAGWEAVLGTPAATPFVSGSRSATFIGRPDGGQHTAHLILVAVAQEVERVGW